MSLNLLSALTVALVSWRWEAALFGLDTAISQHQLPLSQTHTAPVPQIPNATVADRDTAIGGPCRSCQKKESCQEQQP